MADTPAVTPGDGIGAATVALFLGVATFGDPSDLVAASAVAGATIVSCVAVYSHGRLREARNRTEQTRLVAEETK